MTTSTRLIRVELPPLHKGRNGDGGQVEIFNHPARFKVVVCGRRYGKTTLGSLMCLRVGLNGGRAWWVAPTYPIAEIGWRMIKSLARQIPETKIIEGDRYVVFPGEGEVWVKSADNPDSLRGEGLDFVVLDEVAQIREVAWIEALRPALTDKRGGAMFIGTPKGKNWVWRLFQRGLHDPNWHSWQRKTVDNPYIDPNEVEEARLTLPEAVFKQEYEADFGASQLQVYPEFDRDMHMWKQQLPIFDQFFGGLDFGGDTIGAHKSAGVIFGRKVGTDILIALNEFKASGSNITERQLNWVMETEKALREFQLRNKQRASSFHWRADRSQSAFIQIARGSFGLMISPASGRASSVQNGVNLVQRRLEFRPDGLARLYYLPSLVNFAEDMEKYHYPDFRDENVPQATNPAKVDDDLMDAVRYGIEGADQYVVGDPMEIYKNQLPTVAMRR